LLKKGQKLPEEAKELEELKEAVKIKQIEERLDDLDKSIREEEAAASSGTNYFTKKDKALSYRILARCGGVISIIRHVRSSTTQASLSRWAWISFATLRTLVKEDVLVSQFVGDRVLPRLASQSTPTSEVEAVSGLSALSSSLRTRVGSRIGTLLL
jgi:hypothetical protein